MPNGNARGSSYDRRARRAWLLTPAAGWGGDGVRVPCWECRAPVTMATLHVDRIVPAHRGGRYVRSNIRPQCATCSHREGYRTRRALRVAVDPFDGNDRCRSCGAEFWHTVRNGHADGCTITDEATTTG